MSEHESLLPARGWEPDWASPPGDTLIEALEERGWTQAHLARQTGFTQKHINRVVKGKASVGVSFAVALERLEIGSARFWLHRDADYRLALHRQANRDDRHGTTLRVARAALTATTATPD